MNGKTLSYEEALAYLGAMTNTQTGAQGSLPLIKGMTSKSVTKFVSGIGTNLAGRNGQLLLPADKKETGITNFENGNILPSGKFLLVYALRSLFDNTTANVTPLIAKWKDNAPAPWLNGEIQINQAGTGTLVELTGTETNNFKASYGNDADFKGIVPILIRPEARFEFQAILAGGAGAEAWRYEFRAIEFNLTSQN